MENLNIYLSFMDTSDKNLLSIQRLRQNNKLNAIDFKYPANIFQSIDWKIHGNYIF